MLNSVLFKAPFFRFKKTINSFELAIKLLNYAIILSATCVNMLFNYRAKLFFGYLLFVVMKDHDKLMEFFNVKRMDIAAIQPFEPILKRRFSLFRSEGVHSYLEIHREASSLY